MFFLFPNAEIRKAQRTDSIGQLRTFIFPDLLPYFFSSLVWCAIGENQSTVSLSHIDNNKTFLRIRDKVL